MPSYKAPLDDVLFLLKDVFHIERYDNLPGFADANIETLAAILGDKPFLMGEKPCAADAFVFGIVTSILTPPLLSPIRAAMQRQPNLVAYRDRITSQYFSGSPLVEADRAADPDWRAAGDRPRRSSQEKRALPS